MIELRPPPGDDSVMPLARLIAEEVAASGPITFARFIELAIGHPEHGYYASSVERVGYSGDFLTAPETHPLFGRLLARQTVECWELLGRASDLRIREEGAGRGTLATQILDAIAGAAPVGLSAVTYELRDLNSEHFSRLQERFKPLSNQLEISVGAADEGNFAGVVVANELLDALPFHRLEMREGELRELFVSLEDGWFVERPGPLSQALGTDLSGTEEIVEGQIFETSPAASHWMCDLARWLERGFAIIIDYGYKRDDLRDPGRFPGGTLKTYRRHEVGENPFVHIGAQDITAHVDFTAVVESAAAGGLKLEGITSLAEFSAGLGLDELLLEIQSSARAAEDYLAARTAAMELLNPAGLGRFRVAIFSRGVDVEEGLRGLSFRMPGL